MSSAVQIDREKLKNVAKKTVIITGGSSGIGLESSLLFHSLGANVVICDRSKPSTGVAEASQLLESQRVRFVECDVTQWASLVSAFKTANSTFGSVDIVCVNAGVSEIGNAFFSLNVDDAGDPEQPSMKTLDIDLIGAIYTISLAMHYLSQRSEGGSIIVTSSLAGYTPLPEMPLYAAAKHGLVGILRSLKWGAAERKIAVSLVAPGMTPTPILGMLPGVSLSSTYTSKDLDKIYSDIKSSGMPANKTETVALAMAYLAAGGLDVAGHALMVSGNMIHELEGAVFEAWPQWLLDQTEFLLKRNGARLYSKT